MDRLFSAKIIYTAFRNEFIGNGASSRKPDLTEVLCPPDDRLAILTHCALIQRMRSRCADISMCLCGGIVSACAQPWIWGRYDSYPTRFRTIWPPAASLLVVFSAKLDYAQNFGIRVEFNEILALRIIEIENSTGSTIARSVGTMFSQGTLGGAIRRRNDTYPFYL